MTRAEQIDAHLGMMGELIINELMDTACHRMTKVCLFETLRIRAIGPILLRQLQDEGRIRVIDTPLLGTVIHLI